MDPGLSFLAELNTAILHELIIPTMDPSFGPGKSSEREVFRLFRVTYSPETVHSPNLPTVPVSRICCGRGWGTCHSLICREEDNRYSYFDATGNILYDSSASVPLTISRAASSRMLGLLQGRQRTVMEMCWDYILLIAWAVLLSGADNHQSLAKDKQRCIPRRGAGNNLDCLILVP
jgi:hypothetical protein